MYKRIKFRPVIEDNFIGSMCSYLRIAYITGADINIVNFSQENDGAHELELYDTIVVSVKVRPSYVARGQHMCLISSILLVAKDEMHLDLGVTGWNASTQGSSKGIEGVKVVDLI